MKTILQMYAEELALREHRFNVIQNLRSAMFDAIKLLNEPRVNTAAIREGLYKALKENCI